MPRLAHAVLLLFLATALALSARPHLARAQASDACQSEHEQAEEYYYAAEFDAAINLLQTCLQENRPEADMRVRMYRLLGFAHIAQGNRSEARRAIERLLDVRPSYTPDPSTDRPDFVELVREVKATRQPADASEPDRRWVRWVFGGVGVAAAGVLTAILVGGNGGGGSDDLPGTPPPLPSDP